MFDKWLKLPAHYYLRITALVILVVGVAVSNVLMSIGAIWIISNWLIEAKFSEYSVRLKSRPEIILILIFLFYSMLSIAWSDDFWYAFHDIRIKLPLLAIPLALGAGKPLEKNIFIFLLYIFIAIVCFTALYNYFHYVTSTSETEIREMSVFISQIRFATLVNLALFSCAYLLMERKLKFYFALPLMVFFLFYTVYAQVLNGYVLFVILSLVTFIYFLFKLKQRVVKVSLIFGLLLVLAAGILYLNNILKTYNGLDEIKFNELELTTVNGNFYLHDTTSKQTENGHYVWLYVQQEELKKQWNMRSEIAYDSTDRKGQPMYGTLLRYLTSKNERKDSAGAWTLTEDEINRIENGCTGINMNHGLESKLHSFLFEYEMYKGDADPNGFSLLQRLEHLKTAQAILGDYWLIGVGIGDVDLIFQKYYSDLNSQLIPENRLRAHNQFISSWIALGVIGFILLLAIFVVPFLQKFKRDYFLVITMLSLLVAFVFEDMLETQAGATIFALFYSMAVFRAQKETQS